MVFELSGSLSQVKEWKRGQDWGEEKPLPGIWTFDIPFAQRPTQSMVDSEGVWGWGKVEGKEHGSQGPGNKNTRGVFLDISTQDAY